MRNALASEAAGSDAAQPEYLAKVMASDIGQWTKLIKEGNVLVE